MKFHDQMTDEELLALTEEEAEDCAKLLLAKDGLPFPGTRPEVVAITDLLIGKHESFLYEVGGFFFQDEESAKKAVDALNGSLRVEKQYMCGEYYHRLPDTGDYSQSIRTQVNIIQVPIYLRTTLDAMKQTDNKRAQDKEALDTWQTEQKAFLEKRSEVYSAVNAAANRLGEARRRAEYMEECMRLADNDQVIARRFFEKRYPMDDVKTEDES